MKIVVCVKQVGALGDDVEFVDVRTVDPDYLDYALNEWDSYALEEALRIRDEKGGEVVVVTVGGEDAEDVLVRCLAMGADRAVRVETEELELHDPLEIGRRLAGAILRERPDLALCGAQSSDAAQGATGAALAAHLDLPCAAVVTKVAVDDDGGVVVHRELEGGLLDVVKVRLPAVLTIQTGINEPRYVTMRAMQQAKASEIELVHPEQAVGDVGGYRVRRLFVPESARAEMIDGGAPQIAARLVSLIEGAAS